MAKKIEEDYENAKDARSISEEVEDQTFEEEMIKINPNSMFYLHPNDNLGSPMIS